MARPGPPAVDRRFDLRRIPIVWRPGGPVLPLHLSADDSRRCPPARTPHIATLLLDRSSESCWHQPDGNSRAIDQITPFAAKSPLKRTASRAGGSGKPAGAAPPTLKAETENVAGPRSQPATLRDLIRGSNPRLWRLRRLSCLPWESDLRFGDTRLLLLGQLDDQLNDLLRLRVMVDPPADSDSEHRDDQQHFSERERG